MRIAANRLSSLLIALMLMALLSLLACEKTVEEASTAFFSPADLDVLLTDKATPARDERTLAADVLRGRMAVSLRHLLSGLDPALGEIPYFTVDLEHGATRATHAGWDWCDLAARYALAARVLMRHVGTPGDLSRLHRLEKTLLQSIDRDGLAYRRATDFSAREADIFDQGSVLLYLVERYRATGDPLWRGACEHMIRALLFRAVHSEHGLRFAHPTVLPGGGPGPGRDNWDHADPCHHGGRLLYPLALYLELVPDAPTAQKLFDGLAAFVRHDAQVFAETDGSFAGHAHSRANTLLGLLIRARQTGDAQTVARVRRSVDWLLATTPDWGWIPEFLPAGDRPEPRAARAETDALADLISLLLLLAKDEPRYWATIERYARNGLLQAQWTAPSPGGAYDPRGIFCGYCEPNGFGARSMNCCTPAGALALAALWDAAVAKTGDDLVVHLPLDRADDNLRLTTRRVDGQLRVTIETKTAGRYRFRVPADSKFTGHRSQLDESGEYVLVSGAGPARSPEYSFQLFEKTETRRLGGVDYRYTWRGPFVTRVEPTAARFGFFTAPANN